MASPDRSFAYAQLASDLAPGEPLCHQVRYLVPAKHGFRPSDCLARASPTAAGYSRPAITRSRITLCSNSAMAAMIVNIALPMGVDVSRASW